MRANLAFVVVVIVSVITGCRNRDVRHPDDSNQLIALFAVVGWVIDADLPFVAVMIQSAGGNFPADLDKDVFEAGFSQYRRYTVARLTFRNGAVGEFYTLKVFLNDAPGG